MIQRERKGVFPVLGHVLAERPSLRAPPNGGVTRRRRRAPLIRRSVAGVNQPKMQLSLGSQNIAAMAEHRTANAPSELRPSLPTGSRKGHPDVHPPAGGKLLLARRGDPGMSASSGRRLHAHLGWLLRLGTQVARSTR